MKNYSWQRYWYNDENSPNLINGFLYVHEYTRSAFTLDSVSNIPCLVLRGEPGMGKSREIERIHHSQIEDENYDKLYFNLSSYGDESRLVKEIFESDKINNWKEGNKNLYLFLDSLDEALLNINTLALLLADEIGKLPKERLFLRIACRTAEWANLSVLENKLKELWKEDKCQILQIAPLQQKDVIIAAQDEDLDSDKFLDETFNKNVTALASKPVTLQFLINLFDKNKSLPSTQTELYEKGCLTLCEEKNERRKASKRTGKLTPEKRFIISARIAALMIFGNKSSIWISGITGEEEISDILISELSGYTEKLKDKAEFQITEEDIQDVISNTGLFTSNGNKRIKFSHQTFAEFLAAWYLDYRELSDDIVIKLIGENYLYPQLYETSAWIANQRKSIFEHLMKIAPATLLRSDILLAEDSTKAQLVEILLDLFDKEESEGIDRTYYRKLNHPKLAEQIRPYITDTSKGWLVRTEAIDMAQMCKVKDLKNDFVEIALDKTDDQDIRVRAIYAVDWLGNSETKRKLRPLIFGKIEDDERFRLKGAALYVLWSEHITAKELFSVLSPPNANVFGSYESFLSSELVEKLQSDDLPIALDWLIENINNFMHRISSERRTADEILLMAWENLERKEIFEKFIKIVNRLLSNHKDIFEEVKDKEKLEKILRDVDTRHKIWLKIFSSIDDERYWSLDSSRFIGLRSSDIKWLAKIWEQTTEKKLKEKLLTRLKEFISYWGTPVEILDEIFKVCDENKELKKEFEEIFAPIERNSEKAIELRKSYRESTRWRREREKREAERNKPVNPSPMELTLKSLEKIEKGEINSFIELNYQMMFLPNGWSEKSEFESDLTILPVWKDADENVKAKIIKAAKEYIERGNPQDDGWVGTNSYYYSALSGYKALVLLKKLEPEYINSLRKNIWEKWAAIIYHYPRGNGDEEYEIHHQFVAKVYNNAPHRIIELLKIEIESDTENKSYWSFEKLKYCWDEKLKSFLKEELKNSNLSIYGIRKILSQLLELNDEEAGKIACSFIEFPIPEGEKEQQVLMTVIELIVTHGKISCWGKIWQILENNVEFGRKIIEFGVFRFGRVGIQDLSEKQMSDLYVWLSKQYPHKEDPIHYGVYSPGARDEIVRWRDSLLGTLREKGTVESVDEIKKIKEQFPDLEWLKFTLLKAEEKVREMTWQPLEPRSLLKSILGVSLDNSMQQIEGNGNTIIVSSFDDLEFNGKSIKQNPYLRELLEDYRKNPVKFAFFTGAGLSAGVFPMWKPLLNKMVEYCFNLDKLNQQEKEEISEMLSNGDFLDIASICKEKLGVTNYEEFLRREFSKKDFSPEQVSAYRQLFKIKPKTIITTNFDLIPNEIANIRSMKDDGSILDASSKYSIYGNSNTNNAQNDWSDDKPIVFKMHGCISAGGIVFTQEDFREIIYGNSQIRNFLNAIFTKQTVIFIGFGLSDPHIDSILSYLHENNKGKGKPHYILINDIHPLKIQRIEKKYEIRVINYISTDGHPQVLEFLELLEKVKEI